MKLRTNAVTERDFFEVASLVGVTIEELKVSYSRTHQHGWRVLLSGSSSYDIQNHPRVKAALYDEWGEFLGRLYRIDPTIVCDSDLYLNQEHFIWSTGNRFTESFRAKDAEHRRHTWGVLDPVVTNSYFVSHCQRDNCNATMRMVNKAAGFTWNMISEDQ